MKKRKPLRLRDYDYSEPGAYFVTICTCNRECLFGEIVNGGMKLNEWGRIVYDEWVKTADLRANVQLDEFVLMPNHFHGIVVLKEADGTPNVGETRRVAPTVAKHTHGPIPGSIGAIVGQFKSIVTKRINTLRNVGATRRVAPTSIWQRNYYERIIRNEDELFQTRQYIQENPLKWDLDPENPHRRRRGNFADVH